MPSAWLAKATYWPLELMPELLRSLGLRGVTEGKVGGGVEMISVALDAKFRRKASFLLGLILKEPSRQSNASTLPSALKWKGSMTKEMGALPFGTTSAIWTVF